jgi:hypothetical protein
VEQRPRLSALLGMVVGCPRKGEQAWWPTGDRLPGDFRKQAPGRGKPVPAAEWVQGACLAHLGNGACLLQLVTMVHL